MENKLPPNVSESELADRIIDLHDTRGLGFRKISRKLSSEGFRFSKDRAFRLYHKYKVPQRFGQETHDEELQRLCRKLKKAEERAQRAKAKRDIEQCIVMSLLQEADFDFSIRRKIFKRKKALFSFVRKVLPVTHPALWLRLVNFCTLGKIDLANAIQEALGAQSTYEETRREYAKEGKDCLLHVYLSLTVDDWLSQEERLAEETTGSANPEEDMIITIDVTEAELSRVMRAQYTADDS